MNQAYYMVNTASSATIQTVASLSFTQALVKDGLTQVDQVILQNIDSGVPLIPQLARHIIAAGGKRLRPALTLLCAQMCGYKGSRHVHLAACVEFIHTATLLHDDVVDESILRRGNTTANEVWGNKASVLVGDFLLSRAFQLMVGDGSLQVLKILSDASAIIAQGEVLQLSTANDLSTSQEQYLEVVTSKTATLFAAACELGAVVSGKKEWEVELRALGMELGTAFQIVDDALDYAAKQIELGKSIGDDFREGKITLPIILAYTRGDAQEKTFWKRTLEDQHQEVEDINYALELITKHTAITDSIKLAQSYCDKARARLSNFPECREKRALLEIIDFCTQRAY